MSATEMIHAFFCGLGGHDLLMNVEPNRLSLKCTSCPYETPGWQVKTSKSAERQTSRSSVLVPHNIHS
jgi:hypothetical protein